MLNIQGKQHKQTIYQGATSSKNEQGMVAATSQKAVFEVLVLRQHSFLFLGSLTRLGCVVAFYCPHFELKHEVKSLKIVLTNNTCLGR